METETVVIAETPVEDKRRGRPKGSKNKIKALKDKPKRNRAKVAGTKAQTQVTAKFMQLIRDKALAENTRPADVIRETLYTSFGYTPEE